MREFLLGVLVCWSLIASASLAACSGSGRDDDRFWMFLCFPILVVVAPPMFLWYFLCHPWRNVIKPVDREDFESLDWKAKGCKAIRIADRFYFCTDWSASRWYNRLFFVKIRKEN